MFGGNDVQAEAARTTGNDHNFAGEGKIFARQTKSGPGSEANAAEGEKCSLHPATVTAKTGAGDRLGSGWGALE